MTLETIKLEGNRLTLEDADGFASVTILSAYQKVELLLSLYKSLTPGDDRKIVLSAIHTIDTTDTLQSLRSANRWNR